MPDAKLREQRINGADLDTGLAAGIAQDRSTDVVVPIGLQQGQGSKTLDDPGVRLGARETLQQLLNNQSGRDDNIRTEQGILEMADLRFDSIRIAAKSQRPNAGVNQKGHQQRDRPAL